MTTTAPVVTKEDIVAKIESACGIVDGKVDGIYIGYSVTPIAAAGSSSWRRFSPSGRYSLQFRIGYKNSKVYRTKTDGSFPIDDIVKAVNCYVVNQKAEKELEATKASNDDLAKELRDSYKGKKYLSAYHGSSSYVSPGYNPNTVNVQISYGNVTPEVARKILALLAEVESN